MLAAYNDQMKLQTGERQLRIRKSIKVNKQFTETKITRYEICIEANSIIITPLHLNQPTNVSKGEES